MKRQQESDTVSVNSTEKSKWEGKDVDGKRIDDIDDKRDKHSSKHR